MSIQALNTSFTGSVTYRISKNYAGNIKKTFLENEVLNVIRKQDLPASIHGKNFDITFDPKFQQSQIKQFKDTLDAAGIQFKLLI